MVRLQLLGRLELELSDGMPATALLSQPKRVAILAYLAAAHPRGFHRRDSLLAVFWPESDAKHARSALRQTIHFLRGSLGDGVLMRRGREEIGLNPEALRCDVWAFEEALEDGRHREAVRLYRGALLPGLHLTEAPAFDQWLDERREELRRGAVEAARSWGRDALRAEAWKDAVEVFRNGLGWAPYDESLVRGLLRALWVDGKRAAAIREYEAFTERLRSDLGLDPSNETEAVLRDLRESGRGGVEREGAGAFDRGSSKGELPAPRLAGPPPPAVTVPGASDGAAPGAHDAAPPGGAPSHSGAPLHAGGPPSGPSPRWRRLLVVGAGVATLAAIAVGRFGTTTRDPTPPRLAVLPMASLSSAPEDEIFAVGLHEEILTQLYKNSSLEVIGRTSVARYKGSDKTIAEVAGELGVDLVVESSLRRNGDRVRVTVQLVDARTEAQVWAETYDRSMAEVFAIQTDVARRIARALRVSLTPEEPADSASPTRSLEAYTAFLEGLYHERRQLSSVHARQAAERYRRAVTLDREFAPAWARLVVARLWLADHYGMRTERDSAAAALDRLERLAPSSLETRRARGIYFYRTGRYGEALQELESVRAELPSDPMVLLYVGALLRALGRWEEARQTLLEALRVDPVNPNVVAEVGFIHRMTGRTDEAKRYLRLAVSLDASIATHWSMLAEAHLWDGGTDRARAVLDSAARRVDPGELLERRVQLELFARRPAVALEALFAHPAEGASKGWWAWWVTEAAQAAGRSDLVHEYADTLRAIAGRRKGGAQIQMWLARAYACLGNGQEAQRRVEAVPVAEHALAWSQMQRDIAEIYVIAGRHDEAVALIRDLLSRPGDDLSVPVLRLDPIFDPLRDRADFRALVEPR